MHPADIPLFSMASVTANQYGMLFDQPPLPDRELSEGMVMECGSLRFDVLHLPGHSPGHVAFVGEGLCISGDVLFAGSMGRTDLPLSNPAEMRRSLARIASLPEDLSVLPGHGSETTIGRELATNPFLQQVK
jgi:glyoxylase-like metal-dependent hydrolase (beta-lactamase superfamily II)